MAPQIHSTSAHGIAAIPDKAVPLQSYAAVGCVNIGQPICTVGQMHFHTLGGSVVKVMEDAEGITVVAVAQDTLPALGMAIATGGFAKPLRSAVPDDGERPAYKRPCRPQ